MVEYNLLDSNWSAQILLPDADPVCRFEPRVVHKSLQLVTLVLIPNHSLYFLVEIWLKLLNATPKGDSPAFKKIFVGNE